MAVTDINITMSVEQRSGAALEFDRVAVYNTPTTPSSATVTLDTTGAVVGVELVCYFNHGSEPTWPAGITAVGLWNNGGLNIVRMTYQSPTEISAVITSEAIVANTGWTTVRKVTSTTRSSTSTLAVDPVLFFPMAANTKYLVRGHIFLSTNPTPNFKYRFSGPAAPTALRIRRTHTMVTPGTAPANTIVLAYDTADQVFLVGVSQLMTIEFEAYIDNGANAGNFEFLWAQNTSNAANTVVTAGYIEYIAP